MDKIKQYVADNLPELAAEVVAALEYVVRDCAGVK